MKRVLIMAMAGSLSFAAVLAAQEDAGVREAARFERAKAAADARQARIEGQRAESAASGEARDGRGSESDGGAEKAVAFERAKAAADAREARIEGQPASVDSARFHAASHR